MYIQESSVSLYYYLSVSGTGRGYKVGLLVENDPVKMSRFVG